MFEMKHQLAMKFECPRCGRWITMQENGHFARHKDGKHGRWCLHPRKEPEKEPEREG